MRGGQGFIGVFWMCCVGLADQASSPLMREEITMERSRREAELPGVFIEYFSSPDAPLIQDPRLRGDDFDFGHIETGRHA